MNQKPRALSRRDTHLSTSLNHKDEDKTVQRETERSKESLYKTTVPTTVISVFTSTFACFHGTYTFVTRCTWNTGIFLLIIQLFWVRSTISLQSYTSFSGGVCVFYEYLGTSHLQFVCLSLSIPKYRVETTSDGKIETRYIKYRDSKVLEKLYGVLRGFKKD